MDNSELEARKDRGTAVALDDLKKTAGEAKAAIEKPARNRAEKRRREAIARGFLKKIKSQRMKLEKEGKL